MEDTKTRNPAESDRSLAEAVEAELFRIDGDNDKLRHRVNALERGWNRRTIASFAAAVVVAFLFGVLVARAAADPSDSGDSCADALAGVVEAVETTWTTASEAVDRAQSAVRENPDVRACLDQN